jgi:hypothetical protein
LATRPEKLKTLPLEDLKAHPEIITDLLSCDDDVSVVLDKRGDTVRSGTMRTYPEEAVRIVERARAEHAELKRRGYDREGALEDFRTFRRELTKRSE